MKTCTPLKRVFLFLTVAISLAACTNGKNRLSRYTDPANNFILSPNARVKDEHGKNKKLTDLLVTDATFVLRIKGNHPRESKYPILENAGYFTEAYPLTDSIIILTDKTPDDTSSWGQSLKLAAAKVRVYQIEDSWLPTELESKQLSYVFFLNRKLEAVNIFIPTLQGYSMNTYNYFYTSATLIGRKQRFTGTPLANEPSPSYYSYADSDNPNKESVFFSGRNAKVGDRTLKTTYYEDFFFYNKAKQPLTVEKVSNSNNWSSSWVYAPEKPVAPGARCRIRVYYRPSFFRGRFYNKINVYTNTDRKPLTFTISGYAVKQSDKKGISWSHFLGETKTIGLTTYKRFK
jgi:hypothetical protein